MSNDGSEHTGLNPCNRNVSISSITLVSACTADGVTGLRESSKETIPEGVRLSPSNISRRPDRSSDGHATHALDD